MSTTVILNGLSYSIPAEGDANWGLNVSNYLIAIASACLQKTGGTYTLTAEVDFGATYGLKLSYVKSRATNPSSAGILRLGNNESVGWRNAANTGDLLLKVNSSDNLEYNGTKVTLSGAIVDADISASAAITLSKLAALTASRVLVSDGSGVISASSVTTTTLGYLDATSSIQTQLNGKEPTISNLPVSKGGTGSTTVLNNNRIMQSSGGNIVEAAAITAARVLISDANGIPTHSSVTNTTLSYLDATSSIQTQLNGKEPTITTLPISQGGTNSSTALTNDRVIISNGNKIVESSTTTTTLGYLDATSSIQTQLNAKAPLASPSLTTPDIGAAKGASLVLAASSPTLNGSAILQADSTTKGFLPPRMTQAQRDAISTPATGLEVYNTDTNKLNIYNGTSWGEVGSGSSGINYIADTDGTVQGSWVTYADAAGSSPVDGTGGTANVTFATSSNSDLRGTTNFLFTHDAVNRQGQGFSYNFTIDKADQAKMLQIRFDYLVASGTYADGDLTVWVYDVTNATLIQPAPYKILNAVGAQPWLAEFQTASNSTSYRLIFHVTTNTATAYTMRFDNFSVGPQMNRAYGTPVTDWVSYTPTFTSWGTTSNVSVQSRRVGDSLEVQGRFQAGTTSAATAKMSLGFNGTDGGLTIDSNKLNGLHVVGSMAGQYSSTTDFSEAKITATGGDTFITFGKENSTSYGYSGSYGSAFGNNGTFSFHFKVPVSGWSSNTVMSSDAATNVVDFVGTSTTAQVLTANTTKLTFTAYKDSNGAWTTDTYTVPVSGDYHISLNYYTTAASAVAIYAQVDGADLASGKIYFGIGSSTVSGGGSAILYNLKAGQAITLKGDASVTLSAGNRQLSISRISGPAQIAASSVVAASAGTSAAHTVNTNVFANINWPTATVDTNSAITVASGSLSATTGNWSGNNWKYTCPVSGLYEIDALVVWMPSSNSAGYNYSVDIYKNGTSYFGHTINGPDSVGTNSFPFSVVKRIVPCVAGDYLDVRATNNLSNTTTVTGVYLNIKRLGGVM